MLADFIFLLNQQETGMKPVMKGKNLFMENIFPSMQHQFAMKSLKSMKKLLEHENRLFSFSLQLPIQSN